MSLTDFVRHVSVIVVSVAFAIWHRIRVGDLERRFEKAHPYGFERLRWDAAEVNDLAVLTEQRLTHLERNVGTLEKTLMALAGDGPYR